jgi:hypothetical protein
MRRAPIRRLLGRVAARLGVSAVVALAAATSGLAYFRTTGAGAAAGGVAVLAAPTISSATPGAGTVALSWSAVGAPGSGTVSYYVSRDGGAPEGSCPSSSATSTATSCTDAGVSVGLHHYTVTAVWRSWSAMSASASATVIPGPATHFQLTAASTTPKAGEADNLTITALDAVGNVATSYTGSHNLTFGGANAVGAFTPTVTNSAGTAKSFGALTAIVFANGVATVAGASNGAMKLYKAETASVTVASGAVNNGAGLSLTVGFAAESFLLTAASTTPTPGASDNLTITAKDTYGNIVTSYTGSHDLTFGGPHAVGAFTPTVTSSAGVAANIGTATAITFTNGVATVAGASNGVMKLYKAEAVSVTVTDGTLSNGAGLAVTISPAPAAGLLLAAASTTPTVGVADNLTITAKDAYGNTVTAYTGSHSLTFGGASNGPNGSAPTVSSSAGVVTGFGTATAITFTNGVATVAAGNNGAMKLYKAEAASVTVTDGAIGNGAGSTVTAAPAAAASFSLTAASIAPTAGEADNLTVTALDAFGNTATSYTGSHNLTFGGAGISLGGNHPTVSSGTGVATSFGTATAITFTTGVAAAAGASNGVMKLYKVEAASVTVASGAVNNGAGLSVTVGVGAAARLAWTHVTVSAGSLSSPCLFTCTVTALGSSGSFMANVSVADSFGNTVSGLGAGHTVTVTTPAAGAGSGGSFTAPSAGTSVTLTIAAAGAADSTVKFTFKAQSGAWVSDTMSAQTLAGAVYTAASATLNR